VQLVKQEPQEQQEPQVQLVQPEQQVQLVKLVQQVQLVKLVQQVQLELQVQLDLWVLDLQVHKAFKVFKDQQDNRVYQDKVVVIMIIWQMQQGQQGHRHLVTFYGIIQHKLLQYN
jgi:hypothetical protein